MLDYAVTVVRTRTRCDAQRDAFVERKEFLSDFDKAVANDCEYCPLLHFFVIYYVLIGVQIM